MISTEGASLNRVGMKWQIAHRTGYSYQSPVRESFNEVRLKPVTNEHQTVDSFLIKVLPAARLRHYHDFYSNCVHHFEIPEPHQTLMVESLVEVTTHPPLLLDSGATPFPLTRIGEAASQERCFDFVQASRYVDLSPETWRLAMDAIAAETDTWQAALSILRFVHGYLSYVPNATTVQTPMRDVLRQRRGVCQDYAHVMLGLCRTLKIPALYVSGYLASEKASATHAWVEVFIPGTGWQGLDPTHNCRPGETYIKIAVGRDYADVPPVSGHYKGTLERTMSVQVEVRPLVR